MSDDKQRREKLRATMSARFGSLEAWKEWMREIGSKGGMQTYESGQLNKVNFKANRARAKSAGRAGGIVSRRKPRDL